MRSPPAAAWAGGAAGAGVRRRCHGSHVYHLYPGGHGAHCGAAGAVFLCVWLALLPALAVLLRKTIRPAITEEKVEAAITPLCACYAVFGAVLLFQHYFVGPVYVVYA